MTKQSLNIWHDRYKSPAYWWCVFFGAGLIHWAPGTWGSLFGACVGYLFVLYLPADIINDGWFFLVVGALGVTVISVFAINHIEQQTGVHDSSEIVIDEVAGQWIAMIPLTFIPSACGTVEPYMTVENLAYSFCLFRLFDILKPWPINWLDQKVSGGFGVMIDDLVAGLFAAICLYFIL